MAKIKSSDLNKFLAFDGTTQEFPMNDAQKNTPPEINISYLKASF